MQHLKFTFLIGIFLFASFTCFAQELHPTITKQDLKQVVQAQVDAVDGNVAVAFYNLSQPQDSLLINVDETFHAASTMKVPVMIEVYKQAAQGKFNLSDSIVLKNEFTSIVDGSPYRMDIKDDSDDDLYNLIGTKITLYDLMHPMITTSSNLATNVLIDLVDAKATTQTMRDLGAKDILVLRGVEDQKAYDLGMSNTTTARDLMIIMAAIANHQTVSKQDSEDMIKVLLDQQHNDMIPKYLPKSTPVAHKTGSITGVHHDAAIVYLPDGRSYILVLLSKNLKDFDQGTEQLAKISKTIYDYMNRH